jgi:carbamoyltransferase
LGLLYSAFTYYTGFRVNSGEYKVMGLAPYGQPKYVRAIYDKLLDLKPDGTFRLNMEYFNYCTGLTMTNGKFDALFDGPPRKPESPLTQREMDLARSVQDVTEEVMLRLARSAHTETGAENLCLAGGVALTASQRQILREVVRCESGYSGGDAGERRCSTPPHLFEISHGTWSAARMRCAARSSVPRSAMTRSRRF